MMIAMALVAALSVQAPAVEPASVTVSGEGVVMVAPDQAWVRIGAESRSKDAKDAQQQNAALMTAVQQKLASLGIPNDAVRTAGIDLQLEFDYRDGRQTPRGYVARNTIEVRVDDFARLGAVLDAAVGSGATALHGLRFDVKNRAAVEEQALQRAVANGLAKAGAVAAAARRSLDRVLRIEEQFVGNGGPQPLFERAMMKAADVTTPVAAGEIEVRAQVRVTAALRP